MTGELGDVNACGFHWNMAEAITENPGGSMKLIKFKQFDSPPKEVTIHGNDDRPIIISVRPLSFDGQKTVLWALEQIEKQYLPEVFDVPVEMIIGAAEHTGFLESESAHVRAYSCGNDTDNLLIIFNEKLLRPSSEDSKIQFVVTLLHELMRFMLDESDFSMDSAFEARLDLDCYRALGLSIPADHWALKKPGTDPTKAE